MGRIFTSNQPKKQPKNQPLSPFTRAGLSGDIQRNIIPSKKNNRNKITSANTRASIEKIRQEVLKGNELPRAGISGDIQRDFIIPKKTGIKKEVTSTKTMESVKKIKEEAKKGIALQKAGLSGDVPHSFTVTPEDLKVDLPDYIIPDLETSFDALNPFSYNSLQKMKKMKDIEASGQRLLIKDPEYKTTYIKELKARRLNPFQTVEDYNRNKIIRILHEYGDQPTLTGALHAATLGLLDDGEKRLQDLGANQNDLMKLAEIKNSHAYKDGALMADIASLMIPTGMIGKAALKGKVLFNNMEKKIIKSLIPYLGKEAAETVGTNMAESIVGELIVSSVLNSISLLDETGEEGINEFLKNVTSDVSMGVALDMIGPVVHNIEDSAIRKLQQSTNKKTRNNAPAKAPQKAPILFRKK